MPVRVQSPRPRIPAVPRRLLLLTCGFHNERPKMKRAPTGPRNAERIAYLRFKLEMLDKWLHQLAVERRYTDSEFQKLTLKEQERRGISSRRSEEKS